jgi:hypothetical protein
MVRFPVLLCMGLSPVTSVLWTHLADHVHLPVNVVIDTSHRPYLEGTFFVLRSKTVVSSKLSHMEYMLPRVKMQLIPSQSHNDQLNSNLIITQMAFPFFIHCVGIVLHIITFSCY